MKSIIIFSFLCIVLLSYSFKDKDDSIYLYKRSLLLHLYNNKADTVYVIKCSDIELPFKISKSNIVMIKDDATTFLKNKESLYAVKIMPIQITKGDIKVIIVDYLIRENNKDVTMSNTGSEEFRYRYDAENKQYKLIRRMKNTI